MRHILFSALLIGALVLPSTALATEPPAFLQEIGSQADVERLSPEQQEELSRYFVESGAAESAGAESAPEGTVDCFEHYTFNSVQADLVPTVSSTVPGVPVTFQGTIANANPYPVVDGSLFVKIFRKTAGDIQRNGNPVVDAFFAGEDLTVPAKGDIPFSFEWQAPRYLPAGEYEAHFFFLVGKRFNLLGLSFTDDVTGNRSAFSVKGDAPEVPSFDKDAVSLNGASYSFASFAPHFGKDEVVNADVVLTNPSGESRTAEVVWTLSNWSTESGSVLDTRTETVTLSPNERKSLRYVADASKSVGSVTVLRAEAHYRDTRSVVGIRFVRDGFDEIRLNFPGIMGYPVKQGERNTIFSCLHATSADRVDGARLVLTLTDSFGTVLDTYAYDGPVSGAMMGVKHDFTPKTSSSTFTLSAALEKDGKTLETYEATYACEDIDSSLCPMNQRPSPIASAKDAVSTSAGLKVLFGLFLLIPVGLIIWLLMRRGKGGIASFAILLALGSFGLGEQADAKSISWSSGSIGDLCFESDDEPNQYADAWFAGIVNPSATVAYQVTLKNVDTGAEIADGAIIPVGTRVRLVPKVMENTDICWFGSGTDIDTPFGYWQSNGSRLSNAEIMTLSNSIFYGPYVSTGYLDDKIRIYAIFSVNPYSTTFSHSGTAGLSCSSDNSECTITSAGNIRASANFSATYGKFYRKWKFFDLPKFPSAIFKILVTQEQMENGGGSDLPGRRCSNSSSDWQLSVPAQTISFSLTAVGGNNAPVAPTVTGNGGMVDTSLPFTATSTDPDGDTLRYGFDWDKDGSVDQWMPAIGHVASGTAQTVSHAWITEGNKAFQILAEDSKGSRSAWTPYAVAVSVPSQFLTLCISGSNISPYSVSVGDTRDLTAHYGPVGDCSDVVVAGASFADSGAPAVHLEGATLHADSVGSETVTASYTVGGSVLTDDALVNVPESSCPTNCTDPDPTGSGSPSDNENSLNWREVQPGF